MGNYKCIVLSGLSGSGKTTLGQYFAKYHDGWQFMDGDNYFLPNKPKVMLSNGEVASNWDCPEAIDWNMLNQSVKHRLSQSNIIFATFMPDMTRINFHVHKHVKLSMAPFELERCIQARKVSKSKATPQQQLRDELMVREYVYPFYLQMAKNCHAVLGVYENDARVPLEALNARLEMILG